MDWKYRQEMFHAFSYAAALFVGLPLAASALVGAGLTGVLILAASLLVPIYATGFFLAPWAGRVVEKTKVPAFVMSAISALSPAGFWLTLAATKNGWSLSLSFFLLYGFFAVPASILGALLFIGGCQRTNAAAA